jgi:hypothetical protein
MPIILPGTMLRHRHETDYVIIELVDYNEYETMDYGLYSRRNRRERGNKGIPMSWIHSWGQSGWRVSE